MVGSKRDFSKSLYGFNDFNMMVVLGSIKLHNSLQTFFCKILVWLIKNSVTFSHLASILLKSV